MGRLEIVWVTLRWFPIPDLKNNLAAIGIFPKCVISAFELIKAKLTTETLRS